MRVGVDVSAALAADRQTRQRFEEAGSSPGGRRPPVGRASRGRAVPANGEPQLLKADSRGKRRLDGSHGGGRKHDLTAVADGADAGGSVQRRGSPLSVSTGRPVWRPILTFTLASGSGHARDVRRRWIVIAASIAPVGCLKTARSSSARASTSLPPERWTARRRSRRTSPSSER